jgi:hypothetical protein
MGTTSTTIYRVGEFMNSTDQAIAILAVSGHKVDAETKLMLQQIDAGTITHEEAIKRIEEAIKKMPTKCIRTQADIDQFYED